MEEIFRHLPISLANRFPEGTSSLGTSKLFQKFVLLIKFMYILLPAPKNAERCIIVQNDGWVLRVPTLSLPPGWIGAPPPPFRLPHAPQIGDVLDTNIGQMWVF